MITTARQLKDLIRNMSKKKSADAQILKENNKGKPTCDKISVSRAYGEFNNKI